MGSTYVLGIKLSGWARWRGKREQIISHLAEFDWPMHLFIFATDGKLSELGARLKAVAASEVGFGR